MFGNNKKSLLHEVCLMIYIIYVLDSGIYKNTVSEVALSVITASCKFE